MNSFAISIGELLHRPRPFGVEFGPNFGTLTSIAGCVPGDLRVMMDCVRTAGSRRFSACRFCRNLRKGSGLPIDEAVLDELVEAAASNDVVALGRLLGPRDVKTVVLTCLPEAMVRRPKSCMLLDVSVDAGAVEVSKCLFEFHGARPTRETLKMAISSGTLDLIRLLWSRLPGEQHSRGDLLEVA
jgi:hypothetical protein